MIPRQQEYGLDNNGHCWPRSIGICYEDLSLIATEIRESCTVSEQGRRTVTVHDMEERVDACGPTALADEWT